MFGFPMQIKTTAKDGEELWIVLRPYRDGEETTLANSISSYEICQYLRINSSLTPAMEKEWLTKAAQDASSVTWAICATQDKNDQIGVCIGTTRLHDIKDNRSLSSMVIYNRTAWGRGIASDCHRARCYYAQQVLGIKAIDSDVAYPNVASLKALERVGYARTGTKYSANFANGQWQHLHLLTWVNPSQVKWDEFWGDNTPPKKFLKARERAILALNQARREVTFL